MGEEREEKRRGGEGRKKERERRGEAETLTGCLPCAP